MTAPSALSSIALGLSGLPQATRGLPPVHLWHPPHCGELDLLIRADGLWLHEGSPIGRPELVRLFSTVLRKDPDGYHLVTPVEKLRVTVEDVPFRAVAAERRGGTWTFTTDVGDAVEAGDDHPLRVVHDPASGEPRPYIRIRADLEARIERAVFYDLVEAAEERDGHLWLTSGETRFDLGPIA